MARHRKHRKHSNPRRHRRAHRRSRRFLRNPPSLSLGGVGSALLWGGAGYLASKLAGNLVGKYLPASIPARELVGAGVSGALVSYGGGMVAKTGEAKAAVRVGALIPVVEAAVNMTSLGSMLGTQKVIMLPPPSNPSGVSAALHAALQADLRDDGDDDMYSGY